MTNDSLNPKASALPPVEIVIACTSRRLSLYKVEEWIDGIGELVRSAGSHAEAKQCADHCVRLRRSEGRHVTLIDDKAAQS